jgi:hypothetical protein
MVPTTADVPRPIGVRAVTASLSHRDITANQVKSILRFCAPDQAVATRYAHDI